MSASLCGPSLPSSPPRANWYELGGGIRRRSPRPATSSTVIRMPGGPFTRAWRNWVCSAWRFPRRPAARAASVSDLCAMVEEAAAALVPGPVATTRAGHAGGRPTPPCSRRWCPVSARAGFALCGRSAFDGGRVSGVPPGTCWARTPAVCCCCRRRDSWLLVDTAADGVTVEPLTPTDFSRPLARVVLDDAPADGAVDAAAARRGSGRDGAGRRGRRVGPVGAGHRRRVREGARAVRQADRQLPGDQAHVRRDAAALRAGRGGRGRRRQAAADGRRRSQLSIAAAVAAATGIEAAKANAKDCIQVLGGIGITWEHDAHLYLRRAYGISQFLGGRSRWLRRVAALTQRGRAPRTATST